MYDNHRWYRNTLYSKSFYPNTKTTQNENPDICMWRLYQPLIGEWWLHSETVIWSCDSLKKRSICEIWLGTWQPFVSHHTSLNPSSMWCEVATVKCWMLWYVQGLFLDGAKKCKQALVVFNSFQKLSQHSEHSQTWINITYNGPIAPCCAWQK